MGKGKVNLVALIGAVFCLASLLFAYVSLDLFLFRMGIKWVTAAQFTNYVLYAIPFIGLMMLIGSLIDLKPLLWVSVLAGVGIAIYYMVTFRNILNGDLLLWIQSTNTLLAEYVNMEDIQLAIDTLRPFLQLGSGAWLYMIGCILGIVGGVIGLAAPASAPRQNKAPASGIYDGSSSDNGVSGGHY